MSFIRPGNSGSKSFTRQVLSNAPASLTICQEKNSRNKALECKVLLRSLRNEDIKKILRENVGPKNMSRLSAMIEFLEIERGKNVSEDFIRNIILLSLLYGAGRGRREMAFADLVFQALYRTLSENSR